MISFLNSNRRKYHNILDCRDNFRDMLTMCDQLSVNVDAIHHSMSVLNSDYIDRILTEIETMQDDDTVD